MYEVEDVSDCGAHFRPQQGPGSVGFLSTAFCSKFYLFLGVVVMRHVFLSYSGLPIRGPDVESTIPERCQ